LLLLAGPLLALAWLAGARVEPPAPAAAASPTLAAQLARDKIIPGSALARLVKNNQEFHLLAAANRAPGKIDVPLWLKVYYRKQHPKMKLRPKDPTQGYPLALESVHRWMLTHQDLQPARAPVPGQPIATLSAGTNRRISGAQNAPRSESDIRVNFFNPDVIIAASNSIEADGHQAQFYSSDGGTTWGQTSLPFVGNDQFHSDPTVDWTSDGTAWATTIGIEGTVLRMRAYKSVDQGQTWTFDAIFSGDQTEADKQLMWVDHSADSPYRDNIYVIWHNGPLAFINRRTGPGGSWQTPLQVSGTETTGTPIGADITTNNKGDVFGLWPDTGSQKLYVVKSIDGGKSFGDPAAIASTYGSFQVAVPAFAERQALIGVSAAAYSTQQKNLVYAAWMDLSGDDGCKTPNDQPGKDATSKCKTRIWFSRSTDGGTTWEKPRKINDRSSLSDQFNQRLAVDVTNGTLVIVYDDTEGDAQRTKVNLWYQTSSDDGQTWSQAEKVTTAPTNETTTGADSGNQFGDYNGLSGYAGKFFPSWTDRRGNGREEIWTAPIFVGPVNTATVPPPVRRALTNGDLPVTEKIKWAHVIKAGAQDHPEGKAVVYQVIGRDPKGHPCQMLVDRQLGLVIEFRRTLPFDEAKGGLPPRVADTLQKVQEEDPKFKPSAVEVIYLGGKVAAYAFRSGDGAGAKEVVIRKNGSRINTE
jgi:hypothetical protein